MPELSKRAWSLLGKQRPDRFLLTQDSAERNSNHDNGEKPEKADERPEKSWMPIRR
jgi:hypothetical protein